jgi:predicted O-methyltransferase YrrM
VQILKGGFRRLGGRALRALEERPVTSAAAKSLRRALINRRNALRAAADSKLIAGVAPLVELAYTPVDLAALRDPLPTLYAAPELAAAGDHFARTRTASESLVSAVSQALLYALVRNLRPQHVFEIGTYKAGTAEVICRALHANGRGVLHTTDPYGSHRVPAIVSRWPSELRHRLRFHALDSMSFFGLILADPETRADLVFVDGNHDYEFALFDIGCAARVLRPGGFIVVDNVSQAGPYLAARDFLAVHRDWTECRVGEHAGDPTKAFDGARSTIPDTDFMVLRGPLGYGIGNRPTSFGETTLAGSGIAGVTLALADPVPEGVIHAQCVLRGFSATKPDVERVDAVSREVSSRDAGAALHLPLALDVGPGFDAVRLEIWLIWSGAQKLPLTAPPIAG